MLHNLPSTKSPVFSFLENNVRNWMVFSLLLPQVSPTLIICSPKYWLPPFLLFLKLSYILPKAPSPPAPFPNSTKQLPYSFYQKEKNTQTLNTTQREPEKGKKLENKSREGFRKEMTLLDFKEISGYPSNHLDSSTSPTIPLMLIHISPVLPLWLIAMSLWPCNKQAKHCRKAAFFMIERPPPSWQFFP